MDLIQSIGLGAVSGLFIAGAGYFKSYNESGHEPFEGTKFASTVILGAIVGGIASGTGMAPEAIIALPMYAGITAFVENLIKSILRIKKA